MMILSVLEPSIISISDNNWNDENRRDIFLEQLTSIIEYIDEYKYSKLAWSTHIDSTIWSSPQLPPWKLDRDWANIINPILYKLSSNNEYFDDELDDNCIIDPNLYTPRDDLYLEFKRLIPRLFQNEENLTRYIHFGDDNKKNQDYTFSSEKTKMIFPVVKIMSKCEFLKCIPVEELYWPRTQDESEHVKISKAINIILERDFKGNDIFYTYSFDKGFIKKLTNTRDDRFKILFSLAKRLTMTGADARADGAFQEEVINDEFRFRVSKAKRIHLSIKKNHIIFLKFYDEGEHDVGL